MEPRNLHLVCDATGEAVSLLVRASLVQFDGIEISKHVWPKVQTSEDVGRVLAAIEQKPGLVIFTISDLKISKMLEDGCKVLCVPVLCVLGPVLFALKSYLCEKPGPWPGCRHAFNPASFERLEAVNYALNHDDGQSAETIKDADVVLLGASRTSKTPTAVYLANRGVKVANVPVVLGSPIPQEVLDLNCPLVVGLMKDPKYLIQVREGRIQALRQDPASDYVNIESVKKEITETQRICEKYEWPILNITHSSIEETAASIQNLMDTYTRKVAWQSEDQAEEKNYVRMFESQKQSL